MAGANIVAGNDAPIRAILEAYGMAGAAMINSESNTSLALPCLTLLKDNKTTVVVGDVSDVLVSKAASSGALYGAYYNVLSTEGVSAMFNGAIGSAEGVAGTSELPLVVCKAQAALPIFPADSAPSISTIVFVGSDKKLSADEAKAK